MSLQRELCPLVKRQSCNYDLQSVSDSLSFLTSLLFCCGKWSCRTNRNAKDVWLSRFNERLWREIQCAWVQTNETSKGLLGYLSCRGGCAVSKLILSDTLTTGTASHVSSIPLTLIILLCDLGPEEGYLQTSQFAAVVQQPLIIHLNTLYVWAEPTVWHICGYDCFCRMHEQPRRHDRHSPKLTIKCTETYWYVDIWWIYARARLCSDLNECWNVLKSISMVLQIPILSTIWSFFFTMLHECESG